jgi:hypothetical protein
MATLCPHRHPALSRQPAPGHHLGRAGRAVGLVLPRPGPGKMVTGASAGGQQASGVQANRWAHPAYNQIGQLKIKELASAISSGEIVWPRLGYTRSVT